MSQTLITGGDGYMGRRVAARILQGGDDEVVLHLRAADAVEFVAKKERLDALLGDQAGRVRYLGGDLTDDEPFAALDPRPITTIVHTAAVTRFNVDRDTAQRVNVDGTQRVLGFAERCPGLTSMTMLSTVYSSGLVSGPIPEAPNSGAGGFANFYEWSKWEAERLVLDGHAHLPFRILRLATVITDDVGEVTQYNAFHNTLKLYYYGLLSLLPGLPSTPLYFVTGRFATEAVHHLATSPAASGIYHVAHRREESLALGQLIDEAFDCFETHEDFRRRRVLRPLYADAETFGLLSDGVGGFASAAVDQALSSVTPFARQLYIDKDILNDRLRAALPTYEAPEPVELVRRTCEQLVATKWGRHATVGV